MKRGGLVMIYASQKFHHYLLGGHFMFLTNESMLKYLVNTHVLEGWIFIWFLFFQELSFDVIVKPIKYNN